MIADMVRLETLLRESRRTVFFGGAGVSTESGILDFRSADGLYSHTFAYSPEEMLSLHFFQDHPSEFFDFFRSALLNPGAQPNAAHKILARMERTGKITHIITQNIDGLHQAAGSRNVLELHGSVHRNFCMRCGKMFDLSFLVHTSGIPRCGCGGTVKPDVVLYEEPLSSEVLSKAIGALSQADLLLVGGTSLTVYPAAGLVRDFHGRIVVINRGEVSLGRRADLVIDAPIGETLSQLPEDI